MNARYVETKITRKDDEFNAFMVNCKCLVVGCQHFAFKASRGDLEVMRNEIDKVVSKKEKAPMEDFKNLTPGKIVLVPKDRAIKFCPFCGESLTCPVATPVPMGGEWINVRERLPELEQNVIVWGSLPDTFGHVRDAVFDKNKNWVCRIGDSVTTKFSVQYWMPLPPM